MSNMKKMTHSFQSIFGKLNIFQEKTPKSENIANKFLNYKHDLVYRMVTITSLPCYSKIDEYTKPFSAFISKKNLFHYYFNEDSKSSVIYATLSLVTADTFSNKTAYVRLFTLEDFSSEVGPEYEDCVFVNDIIFDYFNCNLGMKVIIKLINEVPCVKEIDIHTKKNNKINVTEQLKQYLGQHSKQKFVLSSDFPMAIGSNIICSFKFSPPELKFVVIDNESLDNLKYNVIEEEIVLPEKMSLTDELNPSQYLETISNYVDIINSVSQHFQHDCKQFENILIIGKY